MTQPGGDYRFEAQVHAAYLHATATGPRTPDNARRFLKDAFGACVAAERTSLILEMNLEGPPVERAAIFGVITGGVPEGVKLRRIAYVDPYAASRDEPAFATTVAANRGVNVRLFADAAAAAAWLLSQDLKIS